VDAGGVQRPPQGSVAIRVNRMGNHFAIDVTPSTARASTEGRILVARCIRALTEGAIYAFPQDLKPGDAGSPVVDGGGQQGQALNLRGFRAGYQVLEGQFFSLIVGGRRYLHCAMADVTATGGGDMLLPFRPMLRVIPGDGAVCEFAQPMIEGFLGGTDFEWQLQAAPYLDAPFTIEESA
jgi:hypothetical protein